MGSSFRDFLFAFGSFPALARFFPSIVLTPLLYFITSEAVPMVGSDTVRLSLRSLGLNDDVESDAMNESVTTGIALSDRCNSEFLCKVGGGVSFTTCTVSRAKDVALSDRRREEVLRRGGVSLTLTRLVLEIGTDVAR